MITFITEEHCCNTAAIAETGDKTLLGTEIQVNVFVVTKPLPRHRLGERQCEEDENHSHPGDNVRSLLPPSES